MIELTGSNLKYKYTIPWQQRGKSYPSKIRTSPSVSKAGHDNATLAIMTAMRKESQAVNARIMVRLIIGPETMKPRFERTYI